MKATFYLSCCAAAIILRTTSVDAQVVSPAPAAPAAGPSETETAAQDIIVTAQRRSERLQDVPIAVTALPAAKLSAAGVVSTIDLGVVTPGLDIRTAAGAYVLTRIRGVGTSGNGPGIENPVALYIDGVYIASTTGSLFSLNDIDQVAVLKGPQGTLFGRNATGGVIQVTTRTPQQQFHLDAEGGYGNLDTWTGKAYVTGGLTKDLSASVSAYYSDQGKGFGHNVVTGNDVNRSKTVATRGKLYWTPGTTTRVTLSADYSRLTGALPALRPVDGARNALGLPFSGGKFDIEADTDPRLKASQYGVSLRIQQELGALSLESITAYRNTKFDDLLDYDETPVFLTNADITQRDHQFSQELQLQPTTRGKLSWIVGAFYFHMHAGYQHPGTISTGLVLPGTITLNSQQNLDSLAGYGQLTYKLDDATNLTAGLRYTEDWRDIDATGTLTLPVGAVIPFEQTTAKDSKGKLTWRLSVDHRFSPEVLAYASYNRGFKSGSYVPQIFPAELLKPETLDAFEAGIKTDLLDRRLRLNVSAYYYDYKNIQVQLIQNGIVQSYNGSGARMYGLDGDANFRVTRYFSLTGGISYIHGRYKSFENAFYTIPRVPVFPPPPFGPNGGNIISTRDAKGNKLQQTPTWTFNVGGEFEIPVAFGRFVLSANLYHDDGWYSDPDNRLRQSSYDIVNSALAWHSRSDRVTIAAWGKNLFDKFYASQLVEADVADTVSAAPGRTYGFTVGFKF